MVQQKQKLDKPRIICHFQKGPRKCGRGFTQEGISSHFVAVHLLELRQDVKGIAMVDQFRPSLIKMHGLNAPTTEAPVAALEARAPAMPVGVEGVVQGELRLPEGENTDAPIRLLGPADLEGKVQAGVSAVDDNLLEKISVLKLEKDKIGKEVASLSSECESLKLEKEGLNGKNISLVQAHAKEIEDLKLKWKLEKDKICKDAAGLSSECESLKLEKEGLVLSHAKEIADLKLEMHAKDLSTSLAHAKEVGGLKTEKECLNAKNLNLALEHQQQINLSIVSLREQEKNLVDAYARNHELTETNKKHDKTLALALQEGQKFVQLGWDQAMAQIEDMNAARVCIRCRDMEETCVSCGHFSQPVVSYNQRNVTAHKLVCGSGVKAPRGRSSKVRRRRKLKHAPSSYASMLALCDVKVEVELVEFDETLEFGSDEEDDGAMADADWLMDGWNGEGHCGTRKRKFAADGGLAADAKRSRSSELRLNAGQPEGNMEEEETEEDVDAAVAAEAAEGNMEEEETEEDVDAAVAADSTTAAAAKAAAAAEADAAAAATAAEAAEPTTGAEATATAAGAAEATAAADSTTAAAVKAAAAAEADTAAAATAAEAAGAAALSALVPTAEEAPKSSE